MDNEVKNKLLKELKYLVLIFIVMLVFFKLHYNKESMVILIKLAIAHFYLFIIPGYALMLYYFDELEFFERFFIGLGIGYGVQPVLLYLINVVIEVNVLRYNKVISLIMILIGIAIFYSKKFKKN